MIELKIIEVTFEGKILDIPIKIIPFNFRNVTKTSNRGLNIEYIIRNKKIDIIGRGSKESLAIENFKEEFVKFYTKKDVEFI